MNTDGVVYVALEVIESGLSCCWVTELLEGLTTSLRTVGHSGSVEAVRSLVRTRPPPRYSQTWDICYLGSDLSWSGWGWGCTEAKLEHGMYQIPISDVLPKLQVCYNYIVTGANSCFSKRGDWYMEGPPSWKEAWMKCRIRHTVTVLNYMIQSSARKSVLKFDWVDPTLYKPPQINFGLIQFSKIPRMKPLSCPSWFILWQQREVKNNFQEKELAHKCSTLALVRLFVAAAAIVYQDSGELKARNSLHFCLTKKFLFESTATHDLM